MESFVHRSRQIKPSFACKNTRILEYNFVMLCNKLRGRGMGMGLGIRPPLDTHFWKINVELTRGISHLKWQCLRSCQSIKPLCRAFCGEFITYSTMSHPTFQLTYWIKNIKILGALYVFSFLYITLAQEFWNLEKIFTAKHILSFRGRFPSVLHLSLWDKTRAFCTNWFLLAICFKALVFTKISEKYWHLMQY